MAKIVKESRCWNTCSYDKVLAVVGSRTIEDIHIVFNKLDKIGRVGKIVSGGADGVDTLAELYARSHDIELIVIKPEWNKYGKAAGFLRNNLIADQCTHCICFWDGLSRGAIDTLRKVMDQNKDWILVEMNNREGE